jgi:hypothetical protein
MPRQYIQGFFDLALVGKGAAPTIGFRGFCCKESGAFGLKTAH